MIMATKRPCKLISEHQSHRMSWPMQILSTISRVLNGKGRKFEVPNLSRLVRTWSILRIKQTTLLSSTLANSNLKELNPSWKQRWIRMSLTGTPRPLTPIIWYYNQPIPESLKQTRRCSSRRFPQCCVDLGKLCCKTMDLNRKYNTIGGQVTALARHCHQHLG